MPRSVGPKELVEFGRSLRDCRKAARLTQDELLEAASRAAVKPPNRSYLSHLENGLQEPGLKMQFRLARAVGVRPSEMLRKAEDRVLPPSERRRIDHVAAGRVLLGPEKCPGCGIVYSKYVEQLKVRERDKFKCPRCKHVLASWLGTARFIFETLRLPKARQAK